MKWVSFLLRPLSSHLVQASSIDYISTKSLNHRIYIRRKQFSNRRHRYSRNRPFLRTKSSSRLPKLCFLPDEACSLTLQSLTMWKNARFVPTFHPSNEIAFQRHVSNRRIDWIRRFLMVSSDFWRLLSVWKKFRASSSQQYIVHHISSRKGIEKKRCIKTRLCF